ncbi:MAG: hypothetical protein ACREA9_19930 [Pyrinomonadaceae bacterium]
MRLFHRFTCVWGLVFACLAPMWAQAVEVVKWQTYQAVVEDYASSRVRFDAELAYNKDERTVHVDTVNSDLIREGHGFRQASVPLPFPQIVMFC